MTGPVCGEWLASNHSSIRWSAHHNVLWLFGRAAHRRCNQAAHYLLMAIQWRRRRRPRRLVVEAAAEGDKEAQAPAREQQQDQALPT